ncbi:MAG TPA: hypothetical protein DCG28_02560 [Lachnospiraceae bacterium]|nr:hypothetical protein [Lachnospiraceae bacterium]
MNTEKAYSETIISLKENNISDIINRINSLSKLTGVRNVLPFDITTDTDENGDLRVKTAFANYTPLSEYLEQNDFNKADLLKMGKDIAFALEGCQRVGVEHTAIDMESIYTDENGAYFLGNFPILPEKNGDVDSLAKLLYLFLNNGDLPTEIIDLPENDRGDFGEVLLNTVKNKTEDARLFRNELNNVDLLKKEVPKEEIDSLSEEVRQEIRQKLNIEQQEEVPQESSFEQAKKSIGLRIYFALILLAALALGGYAVKDKVQTYMMYNEALSLYNAGNYEQAGSVFSQERLYGYKNTPQLKQLCTIKSVKKGDTFKFGPCNWFVLEEGKDSILVIAKDSYKGAMRPYNKSARVVNWDASDLRRYLNEELYGQFDAFQQALILTSNVRVDKNPEYDTICGSNTKDKIYIFDIGQVMKYFPEEKDRQFGNAWWLRTPGVNESFICFVDDKGKISMRGDAPSHTYYSVKPVMSIKRDMSIDQINGILANSAKSE